MIEEWPLRLISFPTQTWNYIYFFLWHFYALSCQLDVRDLVEKKQQKKLATFSNSMAEEEKLIQLIGGETFVSKCCLSYSWSCILWCSSFNILEHTFLQLSLEDWHVWSYLGPNLVFNNKLLEVDLSQFLIWIIRWLLIYIFHVGWQVFQLKTLLCTWFGFIMSY